MYMYVYTHLQRRGGMNIYDTSQTAFHHQEFFSDPLQLALHEKRVDQEQDRNNQGWDVFINCLPFP